MPPAGARSGRLSSVRKWILIVVPTVILLALIVGDQAAKGWAESKLAERAAAYYPPGAGSSASIHSFPFLGRLLVSGSVDRKSTRLNSSHTVISYAVFCLKKKKKKKQNTQKIK